MPTKKKPSDVIKAEFKNILTESGVKLAGDAADVAKYAAERAAYLATLKGKKGFSDAVLAERDAVALKAGIVAKRSASVMEQRLIGALTGALRIAALAI